LNQYAFLKMLSGRKAGPAAAGLQLVLWPISVFYHLVISFRNFLYSSKLLKARRVKAVVISIGNVTTGGTGKTPLVIWVCRFLAAENIACAILTRGYKSAESDESPSDYTDEPAIFKENCKKAEVIVNPDRVAGANRAVSEFAAEVLVMDDGFQHRRLARDLDIVTIDATRPFGYDKMLPAGLLREPACALKRASAVVITRCDQVNPVKLHLIERKLRRLNPDMIIARTIHRPVCVKVLKSAKTRKIGLDKIKNKRVFAVCGIANPDAFLKTVKELTAELAGSKIYNDHHNYTAGDIAEILDAAGRLKAELIISTEKDFSKITGFTGPKNDIEFAYLAVELEFLAGEEQITQLIRKTVGGRILRT